MSQKVLKYVDEEIVSSEFHRSSVEQERNTAIKDSMRAGPLGELTNFWYLILLNCRTSKPSLVRQCLNVVSEYIGWIDIGLIVNDRFMPMIFHLCTCVQFRIQAAGCLYEILAKGMSATDKVCLIQQLQISTMIERLCQSEAQHCGSKNDVVGYLLNGKDLPVPQSDYFGSFQASTKDQI